MELVSLGAAGRSFGCWSGLSVGASVEVGVLVGVALGVAVGLSVGASVETGTSVDVGVAVGVGVEVGAWVSGAGVGSEQAVKVASVTRRVMVAVRNSFSTGSFLFFLSRGSGFVFHSTCRLPFPCHIACDRRRCQQDDQDDE